MPNFRYDFNYEMENFWGDTVRIYGNDDGPAWIEAPDRWDGPHEFRDEEAAYEWAYKRGYRD